MSGFWRGFACLGLFAAATTSCGGGNSAGSTSTSVSQRSTTTSVASTTATTQPLTVEVTVSPDHAVPGEDVTFTVETRGLGTLDSEDIHYGDGGTSGANAGMIRCGDTVRADDTGNHVHSYTAPGTYRFTDEVEAIGPPPSCAREDVTGAATVIVASP